MSFIRVMKPKTVMATPTSLPWKGGSTFSFNLLFIQAEIGSAMNEPTLSGIAMLSEIPIVAP